MTIHVEFIEDHPGDLVDVNYFCSGLCYTEVTKKPYAGHAWPGGSETDYDVYCANQACGELLWEGLED